MSFEIRNLTNEKMADPLKSEETYKFDCYPDLCGPCCCAPDDEPEDSVDTETVETKAEDLYIPKTPGTDHFTSI